MLINEKKNLAFKNIAAFINCSLWNYYRNELSDPLSTNSISFKYKTNTVEKAPEDNDSLTNAKVIISLKHLTNFWRTLNKPLINCEVELTLT